MKRFLLIVMGFLGTIPAFAQAKGPVIKAYAYQRQTVPGTNPQKSVDETGTIAQRPLKQFMDYFIYLETKKGQTIKPSKVWINGIPNQLKTEKISKTPVVFKREGIGETMIIDTLAPKTINAMIMIRPDGELTIDPLPLGKTNNSPAKGIRIEYYWKGKKYFYDINEIKTLEPLVLQ